MTLQAALEGRSHNVRVNAVSPGFVLTQMNKDFVDNDEAGAALWKRFDLRQGRSGVPEDIADVVVLLSLPAMGLVNGHNLVIDK
jgi:NAD(P)-dependent dehydrogenase (short-subunit alcohol dehydrogenase family)